MRIINPFYLYPRYFQFNLEKFKIQSVITAVVEIIKILAVQIFLQYLGYAFLIIQTGFHKKK